MLDQWNFVSVGWHPVMKSHALSVGTLGPVPQDPDLGFVCFPCYQLEVNL